ncbi:ArnT family glycosyltransferase [Argonema antarcticum]|uniref:ArnT family glycosyltransferase n=1 Tax=Argonema antarcticum TaxID=2942763 RepID=UPI002012CDF1|nr:glycosyltransferase family 39 protein [Argonema antarcticum]MCL1471514.1 glycosyltransferase family 39 protein [Argonema antarcticum A004/B2]
MYGKLFRSGEPGNWLRRHETLIDRLWVLGLLIAAIILYTINLGGLPLRDWDEGIVAQVARNIWLAPTGELRWLYPTLGGQPYINKPPLVHLLIAWAYSVGGVNEWTTRLPGTILTALSVPLLYGIGREIFPRRLEAIFCSLIYLTLLPVVRHGRLAMLDGAVLCFFLFMVWCLLRSRRNLRYCLGVGIGFGLICLTKGILGLLLGAIALLFLIWDTPRLLTSIYFCSGIIIGSLPVAFWYGAQFLHYGQRFLNEGLVNQSLQRIWAPLENHAGPPWYYLLEILKYNWPWLLFLPPSLHFAWSNRNLGWAKLVLVWSGVYLLVISAMTTKLPWYVLPIYPALALGLGAYLAEVWHWPSTKSYPRAWSIILALLALVAWAGSIYFGFFASKPELDLQIILAATALTMTLAAFLVIRRDLQFIAILLWGTYVSLILLMTSEHWVWELAEAYPVKPVAEMILKSDIPDGEKIYTSYPYFRPSLNFYSDRQIIPASADDLKKIWEQEPHPYLLLEEDFIKNLSLEYVKSFGAVAVADPQDKKTTWTLIARDPNS